MKDKRMNDMTKTLTAILLCTGLILSAGCAPKTQAEKDAVELKKISKIAAETCGSEDDVESVNLKGFVCKDPG